MSGICSRLHLINLIIFTVSILIVGAIITWTTFSSLYLVEDGRFINPLGEFIYMHQGEVLITLLISTAVAIISGYIIIRCEKKKNS